MNNWFLSLHRDGGTAAGGSGTSGKDAEGAGAAGTGGGAKGSDAQQTDYAALQQKVDELLKQRAENKDKKPFEIRPEGIAERVAIFKEHPDYWEAVKTGMGEAAKDAETEKLRAAVAKLEQQSAERELLITKTNLINELGLSAEHLALLTAADEKGLRQQAEIIKKTLGQSLTAAGQQASGRVMLPALTGGAAPKKTLSVKEAYDLAG